MSTASENKNKTLQAPDTAWFAVFILYIGGCSTALHMGKIPPAIPLLRSEWGLSLTQSGLIVSLYSLLIAICGFLLSLLINRFGSARFAFIAVGTVGIGGFTGALSNDFSLLLVGRTIEGLGWIMSVIVLPSLISALSHEKDRFLLLSAWASFVPVGAGSMLLIAPVLLQQGGWQMVWKFASIASMLASAGVFLVTRKYHHRLLQLGPQKKYRNFEILRKPIVWMLSACFLVYSFGYIPLISFFPSLILETSVLDLKTVSFFAALILLCNSLGSVTAGVLLRRGYSYGPLLMMGLLGGGVFAYLLFADGSSTFTRIVSGFLFSIVGGMVPGVLFATMPRAASDPSSAGMLFGLMMQFSGLGMLLGGVILPGVVELYGRWSAAGLVTLLVAGVGSVLAWLSTRQFEAGRF